MGFCCSKHCPARWNDLTKSNRIENACSSDVKDDRNSPLRENTIQVSRDDAETLLLGAKTGSYLITRSFTSELFISINCGQYITHHAISENAKGLSVGGEHFETISELTEFFKSHPIGNIKLSHEYTTIESAIQNQAGKGTINKSENSWQPSTPLSSEQSSGNISTDLRCNKHIQLEKVREHEMSICQEKQMALESTNAVDNVSTKSKQKGLQNSVSSAGEQVLLPHDEPVPVLPEPKGKRPPPLIPFSQTHSRCMRHLHSSGLKNLVNEVLQNPGTTGPRPWLMTKIIKIIVCGTVGTEKEREYFLVHGLPKLKHHCGKFGFNCDVSFSSTKINGSIEIQWLFEKDSLLIDEMEISNLKRFNVPILVLLWFNRGSFSHKTEPLTIPKYLLREEQAVFAEILQEERQLNFEDYYMHDTNSVSYPYVLRNEIMLDAEQRDILGEICRYLLLRYFEGRHNIWRCFAPEIERTMDFLTSTFQEIHFVSIENTSTEKSHKNSNSIEAHDANIFYQLKSMSKKFYEKVSNIEYLYRNTEKKTQESTINLKYNDYETFKRQSIGNMLPKLEWKLSDMMNISLSHCSPNACVIDEIFCHLLECQLRLTDYFGCAYTIQTVKNYLQGAFRKPLILYGKDHHVALNVIARASQTAVKSLGMNTCVITRFVGSTQDSSSLPLLLYSICFQLSFAYDTDPVAVPTGLADLVEFLPSLLQFATEFQPLIICIAGLDKIHIYDDQYNCFSFLPEYLLEYVKIVVTIDEENLLLAKGMYKDEQSYCKIKELTVQDAFAMLDDQLESIGRTLSDRQKNAISHLCNKHPSQLTVKTIYEEVKMWPSFLEKQQGTKESIEDCMLDIIFKNEKTFGRETIMVFALSMSTSTLGISQRCLEYVMQHLIKDEPKIEHYDMRLHQILTCFAGLLMTKWMNGILFYIWVDEVIARVVEEHYSEERYACNQQITRLIIEFLVNQPSKYDISEIQTYNDFSAGYLHKPSQSQFSKTMYNLEKLQLLPYFLLKANNTLDLKTLTLCNFRFLLEKLEGTTAGHLLNDFDQALLSFKHDRDIKIVKETLELAKEALLFDKGQFPAQIVARLHSVMPECTDIMLEARRCSETDVAAGKEEACEAPDKQNEQIDTNNKNEMTDGNKVEYTDIIMASSVLTNLVNDAVNEGHCLMPSFQCLLRPSSQSGSNPEEQISSFSLSNDTRIIYLTKHPNHFIAWSAAKQSITVYDSKNASCKHFHGLNIKRVVLANNLNILLEMKNGSLRMYDLLKQELNGKLDERCCYFAICDDQHVAALSSDWRCLCIYSIQSCNVVWQFNAPEHRSFENVLISKNGAIAVCILNSSSCQENLATQRVTYRDDANLCTQEELIVVNINSRQRLHSISVRKGRFINKLCAISEDGLYLAHLTEPDSCIHVWDLMRGMLIREIETKFYRVLKLLISTLGNCVVSVSTDSVLRVWNLSDGSLRYSLCESVRSISGGYMDDSHCLDMSEDGTKAVHSVKSRFHHSYIVLWDLVLGKQLGTFTTDYYGLSYEISPNGNYVTSCMPSGVVILGTQSSRNMNT